MLLNKPYYTLHVLTHGLLGYIEVNGQIVVFAEGDPLNYEIPLSHWLKKGINEILILAAPDDGDRFTSAVTADLTFRAREVDGPIDAFSVVATLKFDGARTLTGLGIEHNTPRQRLNSNKSFEPVELDDEEGDVMVDEVLRDAYGPAAVVSRHIILPDIKLPRWRFFDSDDLTKQSGLDIDARVDDETRATVQGELLPIYKSIWSGMAKKNLDPLLPLFIERSDEVDAAFFKAPGTTERSLVAALTGTMTAPDLKPWPISENNVLVEFHDNNKLVRLKQNNDKPLIAFDYEGGGAEYYDFVFRKAGPNWIITR